MPWALTFAPEDLETPSCRPLSRTGSWFLRSRPWSSRTEGGAVERGRKLRSVLASRLVCRELVCLLPEEVSRHREAAEMWMTEPSHSHKHRHFIYKEPSRRAVPRDTRSFSISLTSVDVASQWTLCPREVWP